jgi:flagella basal body P-ring formation protein FlgA
MLLRALIVLVMVSAGLVAEEPVPLVEQITQKALALAEATPGHMAGSRSYRVLHPPVLPHIRPGTVRLETSHLSKPDPIGPFFAVIRILVDGKPAGSARVDMEGRWTGRLLKAKEALGRKAVPEEGQLEEVDFDGVPPAGALSVFPEGFRLKQPVPAGHILMQSDIQAIPILNPGDRVRVELVSGGLSISSEAIARTPAALGEKVRLELPAGKRTLQAVAMGPGMARVDWGM